MMLRKLKQFSIIFFLSWTLVKYFITEPEIVRIVEKQLKDSDLARNQRFVEGLEYFARNCGEEICEDSKLVKQGEEKGQKQNDKVAPVQQVRKTEETEQIQEPVQNDERKNSQLQQEKVQAVPIQQKSQQPTKQSEPTPVQTQKIEQPKAQQTQKAQAKQSEQKPKTQEKQQQKKSQKQPKQRQEKQSRKQRNSQRQSNKQSPKSQKQQKEQTQKPQKQQEKQAKVKKPQPKKKQSDDQL